MSTEFRKAFLSSDLVRNESGFDTSKTQNQRWYSPGVGAPRSVLLCVLCLGTFLSNVVAKVAPPALVPRQQTEVLFLSSSDPDLPDVAATVEQTETRIVDSSNKPVHFSFEYLEPSSSFRDQSRKQATSSYLLQKYRGQSFDLVIAIDEDTVVFAEKIRAKLFPDAALLFFVTDPKDPASWLRQESGRTGVMRKLNYLSTLELALRQNPGTSHVLLFSGSSDEEKHAAKIAHDYFREYESNMEFQYLTDLQFSDLTPRVANLQPDTIVVFLDF